MSYKEVFLYSYSAILFVMFVFLFGKLFLMSKRLVWGGTGSSRAIAFAIGQLPMTIVVWLWSSFLFGSIIGVIWSGLHWLAD